MTSVGSTVEREVAVAVDVGGTKVAAALIDDRGKALHKTSLSIPPEGGEALVDLIVALAKDQSQRAAHRVSGIGVAVAGVVDPPMGTVVWAPNIPAWAGIPLGRILSEATSLPVHVGFDGHLTALGEHWMGAGRSVSNMALIIVGTGVGGGLILDGELYRGSQYLAGALGWMIVEPGVEEGEVSRSRGNLESLVSGPAIVQAAERKLQTESPDRVREARLTAQAVVQAALNGDEICRAVVADAGRYLGRAVASLVSLFNPELVLFGGGLGSTGIFLDAARNAIDSFAQPVSGRNVRIDRALLANDAGLMGAARAVFRPYELVSASHQQRFPAAGRTDKEKSHA